MKIEEYQLRGYEKHKCEFIFKNGEVKVGCISTFFPGNEQFYLVEPINMIEFNTARENSDLNTMRKLVNLVDVEDIKTVNIL